MAITLFKIIHSRRFWYQWKTGMQLTSCLSLILRYGGLWVKF